MNIKRKLEILADAAKYDASCASSGSQRKRDTQGFGNTEGMGICHSYTPDGRCVSLLKILFTNHCLYDCKFCINRISSDTPRARFTVEEVVWLTVEFYRRNTIEGLFLSSGIIQSIDYTMEQITEVGRRLREDHRFGGYIHLKVVPGASDEMIERAGLYADRVSANIEMPTQVDLDRVATAKKLTSVFDSMTKIKENIEERRFDGNAGKSSKARASSASANRPLLTSSSSLPSSADAAALGLAPIQDAPRLSDAGSTGTGSSLIRQPVSPWVQEAKSGKKRSRIFAPAGQTTQMIVGATQASDATILNRTQNLYRSYGLRRVYYSAYSPIPNADAELPVEKPALVRENRLYQADWLLRFYGFQAEELTDDSSSNLSLEFDPKTAWALRNRGFFPVDVNRASREAILRVPGIGARNADRILQLRRHKSVTLLDLRKLKVSIPRARYFVTTADHNPDAWKIDRDDLGDLLQPKQRQLSLFGDVVAARTGDL